MNAGSVVRNVSRRGSWGEGVCVLLVPAGSSARYMLARRGLPVCHVTRGVTRLRPSWVVRVEFMVRGRWRNVRYYWPKPGSIEEVR